MVRYLQLARAPETFKLFFGGDASTAASARALTWHAPTQALFSKTVTSCYLRLADRGVYMPLAMRHNQQLCTNNPNTLSWRALKVGGHGLVHRYLGSDPPCTAKV